MSLGSRAGRVGLGLAALLVGVLWRRLRGLGTRGRGRRKLLLGDRRDIRPKSFLRDV